MTLLHPLRNAFTISCPLDESGRHLYRYPCDEVELLDGLQVGHIIGCEFLDIPLPNGSFHELCTQGNDITVFPSPIDWRDQFTYFLLVVSNPPL